MKKIINRIAEAVLILFVTTMIIAVFWQVFSRYVLNSPSFWTEEFLRFALIWLSMIGGAYAYGKKEHIDFGLIVGKLPESIQKIVDHLIDLLIIVFAAIAMVYGGLSTLNTATGQVSPAMRMPMQFYYLPLMIAGVMFIFYALVGIIERFKNFKPLEEK